MRRASAKDNAAALTTDIGNHGGLADLLNTPAQTSGGNQAPKAYLNIVFFDEQLRPDTDATQVVPVAYQTGSKQALSRINTQAVTARKSGYVYVYVSNESNTMVYFDNFTLTHELASLKEETHYYPFGLTMAGISSKALGKLENKRGFNGNELQNKEFSDGNGIEWYDFNARTYDQQIGRFLQIDPLTEEGGQESLSPYHFSYNNPVRYSDPDGRCPTCIMGAILGAAVDYGTQVAGNLIEGKSLTESLTDVDGGSILTSATIGAATSGASVVKSAVTIGVRANQLSKAQKAAAAAAKAAKEVVEKTTDKTVSGKKTYSKKEAREQAKEKREQQPASENYAKHKARELEKAKGKDARREAHDKKQAGEQDRSKKRLDEDYNKR